MVISWPIVLLVAKKSASSKAGLGVDIVEEHYVQIADILLSEQIDAQLVVNLILGDE